MAKPAQSNEKILKNKVRRAKKEIREAQREIHKLMRESKRGTLDRRKLGSTLIKVSTHIGAIPNHWPYSFR
jgi:plasmid stabilization system protein ParE